MNEPNNSLRGHTLNQYLTKLPAVVSVINRLDHENLRIVGVAEKQIKNQNILSALLLPGQAAFNRETCNTLNAWMCRDGCPQGERELFLRSGLEPPQVLQREVRKQNEREEIMRLYGWVLLYIPLPQINNGNRLSINAVIIINEVDKRHSQMSHCMGHLVLQRSSG